MDSYLSYEADAENHKAGPPSFKEMPVFVTKYEREQYMPVENRSINDIKALVAENIEILTDSDVREVMQTMWIEITKSVNKPTKSKILDFYYELQAYVRGENGDPDISDSDEESQ